MLPLQGGKRSFCQLSCTLHTSKAPLRQMPHTVGTSMLWSWGQSDDHTLQHTVCFLDSHWRNRLLAHGSMVLHRYWARLAKLERYSDCIDCPCWGKCSVESHSPSKIVDCWYHEPCMSDIHHRCCGSNVECTCSRSRKSSQIEAESSWLGSLWLHLGFVLEDVHDLPPQLPFA